MCDPLFISVQLRINKIRYQISVLVTYIHCVVLARNYTHFVTINNSKFLKDRDNGSNTRFVHDLKLCIIFTSTFLSVFLCVTSVNLIVLCGIWLKMFIYVIKFIAPLTHSSIDQLRIQKSSYSMA